MTDVFKQAASSRSMFVELVDSTTGLPKTGIPHTAVTAYYSRTFEAAVQITLSAAATVTTGFTAGRWFEISAANAPGVYRFDVTDNAFATGVPEVVVTVAATGCRTVSRLFDLVNINNQVAYAPNAAANAAGGMPVSIAGGLDLDTKLANTQEITAARMGALTDWINGGRLDLILDIIAADTTTDIPALITALNNLSAAQVTAAVPTTAQIAAAVDVALINTGDGSDLLQAIANQIAADWVAGDASPLAIVAAMKLDATIAQMIARIDAAITTRSSQTSVDDVPTNAELAAALGTGTWATALPWNAAWDAEVQSEAADALTVYAPATPAQVNAEVLDVMNVDTFAELAGPPAATSSLRDKLTWLFMWARNKSTETATQRKLFADDTITVVGTEGVTDDGTTFTKTEVS